MSITELNPLTDTSASPKLQKTHSQFRELLNELRKREWPENIDKLVNNYIAQINSSGLAGTHLRKYIKQKQSLILKQIEKELKIVPKNHYRNMWMLFGFTVFGMPIGVAIALSIGNIGLLGIGIPFGMLIGLALGASLDRKANREGRQLNIEIKH